MAVVIVAGKEEANFDPPPFIHMNFFATWSHDFGTLWVCGWSVRYRVINWNGRDVTTL